MDLFFYSRIYLRITKRWDLNTDVLMFPPFQCVLVDFSRSLVLLAVLFFETAISADIERSSATACEHMSRFIRARCFLE